MDSAHLQDRVHWGLNVAARTIGARTDAYRPSGISDPLAPANRFLRLHAAFSAPDGKFSRANAFGAALWYGVFDAAYTRPGDYLVQRNRIWFVAAQQQLLPTLCVSTNRMVSFWRPAAPSNTGVNDYGGATPATNTLLLSNWPASVLDATGRARAEPNLPVTTAEPYWTVLLPALSEVVLSPSDLITDDLTRGAVVTAAELTDLGWRITARQATT
jgi:hypothetical protein